MPMDLRVGDIVTMKKPHPCGSKDWKLLRVGADIRMECLGCGHLLMLPRNKVEKNIRKVKEQRKPLVADQGRAEV